MSNQLYIDDTNSNSCEDTVNIKFLSLHTNYHRDCERPPLLLKTIGHKMVAGRPQVFIYYIHLIYLIDLKKMLKRYTYATVKQLLQHVLVMSRYCCLVNIFSKASVFRLLFSFL